MKTPAQLLFVVGLACCCFTGCSPKSIKGQAFIVTRSAENIKLGLVDILVLDEKEVTSFLEKKMPAVESEASLRTENLGKAEKELQEAQHALDEFQRTNQAFQPAFLEQRSQLSVLKRECLEQTKAFIEAHNNMVKEKEEQDKRWLLRNSPSLSFEDKMQLVRQDREFSEKLEAFTEQEYKTKQELLAKEDRGTKLEEQVTAVIVPSQKHQADLSSRVASYKEALESAKSAAAHFPNLEFYLSDYLPAPRVRTVTDADGKFELRLPRDGKFAVFAQATRKIGSKSENYAWFFWLPIATNDTPLLLSNNNLVFADYPNQVLPIKPKEAE